MLTIYWGNHLSTPIYWCCIERKGDTVLLSQLDVIKKVLKKFEKKIESLKEYETPAPTGAHVIWCHTKEEMISEEEQMEFRSWVGTLLYLLNIQGKRYPIVWENFQRWRMEQTRHTKKHSTVWWNLLMQQKTENWFLHRRFNKIWNGRWKLSLTRTLLETQKPERVSADTFFISAGCPSHAITWRLKGQKSLSSSLTETEYIAIS